MGFRFVPKSVTSNCRNGVMAVMLRYSTKFGSYGDRLRQSGWLKLDPYYLQQKCSPKNLF